MKQKIYSEQAPKPSGNYSQAIQVDNLVFISGQLPLKDDHLISEEKPKDSCRQCLINISNICNAAGGTIKDVVKLNVYYTNQAFSLALDEVIPEFFDEPYPARIRLGVALISKNASIEVDAIMYKKNKNE
ncbi:RidA family protein [Flavobacterium oreochromis]|uniref:RidA family protein n=1 Tax=Flavobacterium oreochromis TaxID=2906078 RepID=UPI00385EDAC9